MKYLLINIHGFISSNRSEKFLAFRKSIDSLGKDIELISPNIPDKPERAVSYIESILKEKTKNYEKVGLVGHSLGGYYATHIAPKYDIKACLVNPVVRAYEIMCEFYGSCYNPHTNEHFDISEKDIEFLIRICKDRIDDNQRFLLMQQLEDEIVDPCEALNFYKGCESIVEQGGCHDFIGFANHAELITAFLFGNKATDSSMK